MDIEIDESTIGFMSLIEKNDEENEQIQEESPQKSITPTQLIPEENSDKLTGQQQLDETTNLINQLTPPETISKTFLEQLRELRQKQQKQQSEEENQKKYQTLLDEMETQTQMNGLIELQKNKENTKSLQNKKSGTTKFMEILKKQAVLQPKTTTAQFPIVPSNPNQEELKKLKEIKVEEGAILKVQEIKVEHGDIPKVQEITSSSLQSKQKELRKDNKNQEDRIVNLSEINQKFLFKPKKTKTFLPTEVKYFLMFAGKRKRQSKFERTKKQIHGNSRSFVEGEEEFKPNHNRTEKDKTETIKILRQHRQPQDNQNDRERSRDYKTSNYDNMTTGGQKSNQTHDEKTQITQQQGQKQSHFSKTIQDYKSQSRAIRTLQEILEEERLQKKNRMEIEPKQNEKQSNSNVSKDFERIKEVQKKEQIQESEMKQRKIINDIARNNENNAKNIRNMQNQENNSSNCITSQSKIKVEEDKHKLNNNCNSDLSKQTTTATTATPSSSNSGVWGIEPASSSISKKKGIVRGAEYFRQRKLEQEQEKKQLFQSHNQSNSQIKVEFEEPTLSSAYSKTKQTLSTSSLNNQEKLLEGRKDTKQQQQQVSNPSESKLKIKKEEKDDSHIDISSSDKTNNKTNFDKTTLKQEATPPAKSIWVSKKLLKGSNQSNQIVKDDNNQSSACNKIDVKIEQVTTRQQELTKKKNGIKKQPIDLSYFVVDTSGDEDYNDDDEYEQEDSFDNTKHKLSRLLVKEENTTKQKTSLAGILEQTSQESKSKIKAPSVLNKSSVSASTIIKEKTKEQPKLAQNSAPKQQNSSAQSAIPQTRSQSYQQQQYTPLSSSKQPQQQQLQSQQQPTIVSQPQQKSNFSNPNSNTDYQSRTPQGNNFVFINNALKGNNSSFIPSQNQAFLDYKMTNNLFTQPFNTPASLLKSNQPANNINNNNSTFSNSSNNSQISSIMSFIRESDRGFLSQMLEKTKNDNNNNANKGSNGNSQRQQF